MTPRWRIYVRGKHLGDPSTHLATIPADSKAEALADAQLRYFGQTVEVVSEIAWQAMSEKERAMFAGTYEFPGDADPHPNIRRSKCVECGSEILYGRDACGKWRNPPRLCRGPGCIPRKSSRISGVPLRPTDDAPLD